jgi:hypothetical protein
MRRFLTGFLMLLMLASDATASGQENEPFLLTGNQSMTIEDTWVTLDGFSVGGNSTLIIKNARVTLTDSSYTVSENGFLLIINSTLEWQGQGGIRINDDARAEVVDSTIYVEYVVENRTYYGHGFGLSERSVIEVKNSDVGYIKLDDLAKCSVDGGTIGEFGTISRGESNLVNIELGSMILTYERTWLRINQTIDGRTAWTSGDIIESGNTTYPLSLVNVTQMSPPSLQLIDSNLETNNTQFDIVLVAGNSGIRLQDVEVTLLYLIEDVWATVQGSKIELFRCRNGDFNIKIIDSEIDTMESMMTSGFNLIILGSDLGNLNLMFAHPDAPNNVELIDTTIETLYLTPSSPPVYMFDRVRVEKAVALEAGEEYASPLFTGSLVFGTNSSIIQDEREGVSALTRVYMVHVLEEGVPVSGEPYTIINGNRTIHEGETNVNGTMVFPLRFVRRFELIQDPTQGGPYMYDTNNFTSPIMLKVGNHVIDLGFMTETPLTVDFAPENPVQNTAGSSPQIGSLMMIGTLIVIIMVLALGQRKGKLFPQDEGHKLQRAPSTSK